MLTQFLVNVIVAFIWSLLQEAFTVYNFVTGFLWGALFLYVFQQSFSRPFYAQKAWVLLKLTVVFLWEVLASNLNVARIVLSRNMDIAPGIIGLPLQVETAIGITALANMISLTPGTLSLDVDEAESTLYIHVIDLRTPDEVIRVKNRFEKLLLEVGA